SNERLMIKAANAAGDILVWQRTASTAVGGNQCDGSFFSYSRYSECPVPEPMPMPVHGARATGGAFQTVATPRKSNAWPRCAALGDFAGRIHSPGRLTGPPPGAGISPARQGGIGAPIKLICVSVVVGVCLGLAATSSAEEHTS